MPVFTVPALQQIVDRHRDRPLADALRAIVADLAEAHPGQVCRDPSWRLVYAAGFMQQLALLHVSAREYLILTGAPTPSAGSNGPFGCDLYDFVIDGSISGFAAGELEETVHRPGDCFALPRGQSRGAAIRDRVWMLEYARGPIPTMFPVAVAGTLFGSLDLPSLTRSLVEATRMGARQWAARRR